VASAVEIERGAARSFRLTLSKQPLAKRRGEVATKHFRLELFDDIAQTPNVRGSDKGVNGSLGRRI